MTPRGQAAFNCGSKDGRPERAQGPAQCIRAILGQRRDQKGAALLESGSVIRRPEWNIRAPARSRRSRRRRRLQPVPVARHGAAGDVHELVGEDGDEQPDLVCGAKASKASGALRGLRPRQCDFGRLVDESAGARMSFS